MNNKKRLFNLKYLKYILILKINQKFIFILISKLLFVTIFKKINNYNHIVVFYMLNHK